MTEENERPWGRYDNLYETENSKTKIIKINPGERFSLQFHNEREEHWIFIRGKGRVTLGESDIEVKVGDYVYVPKEKIHRVEAYDDGLDFIEIQRGNCYEEDIVRLEDDYNRIK
tara:strand:- start:2535 stop:2876 length:342 start_codon:yes stop_codon:yes gene_type:complete